MACSREALPSVGLLHSVCDFGRDRFCFRGTMRAAPSPTMSGRREIAGIPGYLIPTARSGTWKSDQIMSAFKPAPALGSFQWVIGLRLCHQGTVVTGCGNAVLT